MPRYRKKPVVIEAELVRTLIALAKHDDPAMPAWAKEAALRGEILIVSEHEGLLVKTPEGDMLARPNDMLICGVAGEIRPCKAAEFDATYEAAEE